MLTDKSPYDQIRPCPLWFPPKQYLFDPILDPEHRSHLASKPTPYYQNHISPTLVTNRLKLFETKGRLSASRCELNSLGLPGPPPLLLAEILGRFAGNRLLSSISDTFVLKDAPVGTENLRGAGAGAAEGGKDGWRLTSGAVGLGCVAVEDDDMGVAYPGMSTYEGIAVILSGVGLCICQ